MKLRASRLGIATTSAITYPAIMSAIAIGITTFTVVPVFAESAAQLDCTHPGVASCDGKEEMTSCDCNSNVYACACQKYTCEDRDAALPDGAAGPSRPRQGFACQVISNCETNASITACNGKKANDSCTTSTNREGTCRQWPCSTLGSDNKYGNPTEKLTCVPNDDGLGGPTTKPTPGTPGASSSSSSSSSGSSATPPANNDDSGCSTTPSSSTTGALGAFAITAVVGTLLRLRRRMKKRGQ
jgi:hypothetical protein